jgi:hypothetical protein
VDTAVKTLESDYVYKPDAQFDHVFADPPPRLERQRAEFLDNLKLESGNG